MAMFNSYVKLPDTSHTTAFDPTVPSEVPNTRTILLAGFVLGGCHTNREGPLMFISCSSKPIPEILDLMIFVFQQLNSSNVRAWCSNARPMEVSKINQVYIPKFICRIQ